MAADLIWWTDWTWLDPLMSVFIGIIIVISSMARVLKSSLHILVGRCPGTSLGRENRSEYGRFNGVKDVHDLHVWSICSGHIALSAHIITNDQKLTDGDGIMTEIKARLKKSGIEHTTIQFECEACEQGANLSATPQTTSP
ncbi:MAG: hypothetical protein MZV65_35870 [Chromatiales bacterium]|nr:hypothetical protein [Chromatiales bacterium]